MANCFSHIQHTFSWEWRGEAVPKPRLAPRIYLKNNCLNTVDYHSNTPAKNSKTPQNQNSILHKAVEYMC